MSSCNGLHNNNKKRGPGAKRGKAPEGEQMQPSKEDFKVLKYLYTNLPKVEAKREKKPVKIFYGEKVVDLLMASKWAVTGKKLVNLNNGEGSVSFSSRSGAVTFMDKILHFGLFFRGVKVKKQSSKTAVSSKKEKISSSKNGEKKKISKKKKSSSTESGSKSSSKRIIRVDIDDTVQQFVDEPDVFFIWNYDPIIWWHYVLGGLLLLAIITFCLFPLWPQRIRDSSYYLSTLSLCLIGALILLYVVRFSLFIIIYLVTLGKWSFWWFPNLDENCSFLNSFKPFYSWEKNEEKPPSKVAQESASDHKSCEKDDIDSSKKEN